MSNDYKLCPKCNNALDNNVMQCPYCGEKMWISFWTENNFWNQNTNQPPIQIKNSKGFLILLIILFGFPIVWSIISLIIGIISSIF